MNIKKKEQKLIKIMSYAGAKDSQLKYIYPEFPDLVDTMYVEPFFGSGAVYLNLPQIPKKILLNDKLKDLIAFLWSIREWQEEFITKIELCNIIHSKADKAKYYILRDLFNYKRMQCGWTKKEEIIEIGALFYIMSQCCINRMVRYSNNSFNQGFGSRCITKKKLTTDVKNWKKAQPLLKRAFIRTMDWKDFVRSIPPVEKVFYFIDPPYLLQPISSGWDEENEQQLYNFLHILHSEGKKFVLTNYLKTRDRFNQKLQDFSSKYKVKSLPRKSGTRPVKGNKLLGTVEILVKNF